MDYDESVIFLLFFFSYLFALLFKQLILNRILHFKALKFNLLHKQKTYYFFCESQYLVVGVCCIVCEGVGVWSRFGKKETGFTVFFCHKTNKKNKAGCFLFSPKKISKKCKKNRKKEDPLQTPKNITFHYVFPLLCLGSFGCLFLLKYWEMDWFHTQHISNLGYLFLFFVF